MTAFDRDLLAAKTAAVERHLARVAGRLPADASELKASSDASDAVVLHLWQAVQLVLDVAFVACLHRKLPTPGTYADPFRMLAREGVIEEALAERLARAAGFRNLVAHAYEALDMNAVHAAAQNGPADLRAFLAAIVRSTDRKGSAGTDPVGWPCAPRGRAGLLAARCAADRQR